MIVDRGMVKWLPFKSLPEQEQFLSEHRRQRERQPRPELAEDRCEELDRILSSLQELDRIAVSVYRDGEIVEVHAAFLGIENGRILTSVGALSPKDVIDLRLES